MAHMSKKKMEQQLMDNAPQGKQLPLAVERIENAVKEFHKARAIISKIEAKQLFPIGYFIIWINGCIDSATRQLTKTLNIWQPGRVDQVQEKTGGDVPSNIQKLKERLAAKPDIEKQRSGDKERGWTKHGGWKVKPRDRR